MLSIRALVVAAAVTVWMSPGESRSAFAGMFVSNGYTTFLKVGILLASAVGIVLSVGYNARE
ncbi:MAG: NADH-quinone oxidoreductase subunit N, partial [Rhodospirillaceae bacterium]|nr:NADH-quinone oxidoreductase subunit N [Rhodospirillaceae bacterium]